MQAFRELIKGWLGKILLAIVVVLFSIYGAESLMVIFTKPKPVAQVNGEDISEQVLMQSVELERQRLLSRMGDTPNMDMLTPERLQPRVLQSLIDRSVFASLVESLKFAAPDELIRSWVRGMPQFQVDGSFNQPLLDATIAQMGYQPSQFLKEVGQDFKINQLRQGLMETVIMSPNQLDYLLSLQDQQRSFRYAVVRHQAHLDAVEIDDADIQSYYEDNLDQYQVPEQSKVRYLQLSSEQYQDTIDVTQEELELAYQAFAESYDSSEQAQYRASHILIDINDSRDEQQALEEILALKAQLSSLSPAEIDSPQAETVASETSLDTAEDDVIPSKTEPSKTQASLFAELAKLHSDDLGSAEAGGDLGLSGKGAFVPEFEDALVALQVGEISEPVKTDFGYHLIRLVEKLEPDLPDFESEKTRLTDELSRDKAMALYLEDLEQLKTLAFESDDLSEVATALELDIQSSDHLIRGVPGAGIFVDDRAVELAFVEEVLEGYNSEVLELSDTQAIVVHLDQHTPAKTKPLDQVRNAILVELKQAAASERVEEKGREIIAQARSGTSLSELTELHQLQWVSMKDVKRSSGGAPPAVMQKVFELPKPELLSDTSSKSTTDQEPVAENEQDVLQPDQQAMQAQTFQTVVDGLVMDADFVIVDLQSVVDGASDLPVEERQEMRTFLEEQIGRYDFQDFFLYHRSLADIENNLKLSIDG